MQAQPVIDLDVDFFSNALEDSGDPYDAASCLVDLCSAIDMRYDDDLLHEHVASCADEAVKLFIIKLAEHLKKED